jgi:hypothetical protein
MDVEERLSVELARLRANFGADPAVALVSFDGAWTAPTAAMEEDEAEFIDVVADCLGVGLSLDAALAYWDARGSSAEDTEDDEGNDGDHEAGDLSPSAAHRAAPSARRLRVD